jgi:hypothetical protein
VHTSHTIGIICSLFVLRANLFKQNDCVVEREKLPRCDYIREKISSGLDIVIDEVFWALSFNLQARPPISVELMYLRVSLRRMYRDFVL